MHYTPFTHTLFSLYFVFSPSPQIPGHKLAYFHHISKHVAIILHFTPTTRQINTILLHSSLSLLPQLPTMDTIPPQDINGRSYQRKRRKILSNFINNAIKFTEFGYIHAGYTLSEKCIRFHVQDSGIGISAKNQEQIFDRFIKLNTFARGTGLGLSICKSIVEKLGGEIGVKSTLGCGSTFWFSLPYDPLYKAKSSATGH